MTRFSALAFAPDGSGTIEGEIDAATHREALTRFRALLAGDPRVDCGDAWDVMVTGDSEVQPCHYDFSGEAGAPGSSAPPGFSAFSALPPAGWSRRGGQGGAAAFQ